MKPIRFILAAAILCSFTSFIRMQKTADPMIGIWVYSDYDDTDQTIRYEKVKSFKEDEPGIEFKANGKLIKRQNVGWCGTPPIQYGNNDGTWQKTSDSTITISYTYWGGTAEEDWQIVQVNDTKLIVKQLNYRNERNDNRD